MVFLKSARCARVWLVLASILLSLGLWNTAFAAPQASTQTQPPVAPAPGAHKRLVKAAKQKAAPDPPPAPAAPPPPPTLEQMPAQAPQVHYSRGQLTIVAENSTLADILRAVRTQTGAAVEVPPSATERVVAHLGPGPARDVLTALLNGTHFNYVMIGSPAHPENVERLILTLKTGGDTQTAPPPPEAQSSPVETDGIGPQGMDISEQPVDDPAGDSASEVPQPQPNVQQVKTPEQLLRELQQQQQQQQQQQPPPGGPPPQGGPN